jgi:hypothetical protein
MKINFITPTLSLIIVALIFFSLWQCESGKRKDAEHDQGERLHQQQIQELDRQGQTKDARLNELQAERTKMRDSAKVQQRARIEEIQGYKKTIANLRPTVQAKIDSFPDLRLFVASLDSTIAYQETLIVALQIGHAAEIVNLEQQLKEKGDQLMIERTKSDVYNEVLAEREKEIRKLTRGKRFRNVVIGVLAGVAVWISLKE